LLVIRSIDRNFQIYSFTWAISECFSHVLTSGCFNRGRVLWGSRAMGHYITGPIDTAMLARYMLRHCVCPSVTNRCCIKAAKLVTAKSRTI